MTLFDKLLSENNGSKLPAENDRGNIEYKLRLDSKTSFGKEKLKTQVLWRLEEGKRTTGRYEAHYILGVNDNGDFGHLNADELTTTIDVFKEVLIDAHAEISFGKKYIFTIDMKESHMIYLLIRKALDTRKINEITILVVGDGPCGKTSLISHLTYDQSDDGTGFARKLVFKHDHEKISGMTSYLKKDIIGFNKDRLVNYSDGLEGFSWEDIMQESDRVISIFDTPGNAKYLRTTLHALTTINPDCILLVVDGGSELSHLDNFFIEFFKYLHIPICCIVSKADINKNIDNLVVAVRRLGVDEIIVSSNVTDIGIADIKKYLSLLKKNNKKTQMISQTLFTVYESFIVPDRGVIVSGYMDTGSLSTGQKIVVHTDFVSYNARIGSICKKQIDYRRIYQGESGSIQIIHNGSDIYRLDDINKHIVITDDKYIPFRDEMIDLKILSNRRDLERIAKLNHKYLLTIKNNTLSGSIVAINGNIITFKIDRQGLLHKDAIFILKSDKYELLFGIS